MNKIKNTLLLILVIFLSVSCSKKEEEIKNIVNKKSAKKKQIVSHKKNVVYPTKFPLINNTISQAPQKTIAKIDGVQKKHEKFLEAMKDNNNKKKNDIQELLNIDWRKIQDESERYSWALEANDYKEGKKAAFEAFASLTNSQDVGLSTHSYMSLAQMVGKNGNILKVITLLEDCERKLGLNPNERDKIIKTMADANIIYLSTMWKMRATLSRDLANQKFKGQYDANVDIQPESYWQRLRLKWEEQHSYKKPTNGKAMLYSELAYALMNEKKKIEAIKQLDNAIEHLSKCRKSKINIRTVEKYKKIQKQFKRGYNRAPATYYW